MSSIDTATDGQVGPADSGWSPGWRRYAAFFAAALLVFGALFWDTFSSMVAIWMRSDTFAHGFLIAPISAYLMWTRRGSLARAVPIPSLWGPAALIVLGLGWWVSRIADVLVLEQLAVVGMIPALVAGVLGLHIARLLAFPLAYLVFAVPMGEALIPPMMEFTASFTVRALQLTGIPVFWEGLFFTIPTGSWSVVEGCSGVRYLIASVALGCLYAYLTYASYWRRLAFIAFAIVTPVIANGLRAYMIVMIGHLSGMKLAVGVDHLIYGWVFFGLVMLFMFWVGSFWRDEPGLDPRPEPRSPVPGRGARARQHGTIFACLMAMAVWPALAHQAESRLALRGALDAELAAPDLAPEWQPSPRPITTWTPRYVDTDAHVMQGYRGGDHEVGLYLAYYRNGGRGELINSQNVMVVQKHPAFRQLSERRRELTGAGGLGSVIEARVRTPNRELLVWHWYWVAHRHTTSAYLGKLLQVYATLTGMDADLAGIVVFAEFADRPQEAAEAMSEFLRTALPQVEATLREAEPR